MNKEYLNMLIRMYFVLLFVVCFSLRIIISLIYSFQNIYVGHTIYNAFIILSMFAVFLLIIFITVGVVKYIKNKRKFLC